MENWDHERLLLDIAVQCYMRRYEHTRLLTERLFIFRPVNTVSIFILIFADVFQRNFRCAQLQRSILKISSPT